MPKRHGGSNPSSCANKNGLLLVGRPIFIATVRGDELPFAKRNGEFAYRRHRTYHEAQSIRGICVARRCTNEEVRKVISKYEEISKYVCKRCGKPATKVTTGWISSYCDECAGKLAKYEYFADINEFYGSDDNGNN